MKLFIVLPLNLKQGWERNQVMVGIEAESGGRRVLVHSLLSRKMFRCGQEDIPVVDKVRGLNGGRITGMLLLNRDGFLGFLASCAGHPRAALGKSSPVSVDSEPFRPLLIVHSDEAGTLKLRVQLPSGAALLSSGAMHWILDGTRFRRVAPGLPASYSGLLSAGITLRPAEAAMFAALELSGLSSFFEVRREGAPLREVSFVPANPKFSLSLDGSLNFLSARLQATYSHRVITLGQSDPAEQFSTPDPEDATRFLTRNPKAEAESLGRLMEFGFSPDAAGQFSLKSEQRVLKFLAVALPRLQKSWEVSISARFTQVSRQVERITPKIDFSSSGENWFDMNVNLATQGGQTFSSGEIQRLLQMGQGHVRLKNGNIGVFDSGLLDELNGVLADCSPRQTRPGAYRIDKMHAGYIDSVLQGTDAVVSGRPPTWASAGRDMERLVPIPLGSLKDVLRPYQKHGTYWMNFLATNGFGGILADEMGLGKTIQALAFLRSTTGTALIVCPSSLIHNWRREAERFCPELSVLILEGPDRHSLFDRVGDSRPRDYQLPPSSPRCGSLSLH